MKIISVSVDKFPASCGECQLDVDIGGDSPDYICAALPEESRRFHGIDHLSDLNFRRHDCPLRPALRYPDAPWLNICEDVLDKTIPEDAPPREGDIT